MHKLASRLLRVALAVILLGTVLAQAVLPWYASDVGKTHPEAAYLVVPYSIAAILFIGCGQVALLAVWRLLRLVDGGVIFTRRALRWVDVIMTCGAVATVLSAGVLFHLLVFAGFGGPMYYYLGASVVGGLAFVLLVVVMRGLLESAIAGRVELDEVI